MTSVQVVRNAAVAGWPAVASGEVPLLALRWTPATSEAVSIFSYAFYVSKPATRRTLWHAALGAGVAGLRALLRVARRPAPGAAVEGPSMHCT